MRHYTRTEQLFTYFILLFLHLLKKILFVCHTATSLLSSLDHPYADLADVTLHHGWHTAAVIRELEQEIDKMNSEEFKWNVNWQQVLMALIEEHHDVDDEEAREVVGKWKTEVMEVQTNLKCLFNTQFGSTFRSYNNPTYFSRKLFR